MSAEVRPGVHLSSRYEVLEVLGQGAMGAVYRAWDRRDGREVAVKTLHGADPEALRHLKREFRRLRGVSHPHLVELYELCVDGGAAFFTMEIIAGESLERALPSLEKQPGSLPRHLEVARQLAEAWRPCTATASSIAT